mmetsp:Transcript_4160/g.13344  ORF Transcript_4160/g.13344 Transcript_4160/m.13344 type:complete len:208 (+) Transcript_4160:16-639(+)
MQRRFPPQGVAPSSKTRHAANWYVRPLSTKVRSGRRGCERPFGSGTSTTRARSPSSSSRKEVSVASRSVSTVLLSRRPASRDPPVDGVAGLLVGWTARGEDSGVALGAGALPFCLLGISLGQRRWPAPHSPVAHVPRAPPPRSTPSPSAGALACGRSLAAWRQRSAGEGGAEAPEPPSQRGSHRGSFCRRARADVARSSRRAAPRKR